MTAPPRKRKRVKYDKEFTTKYYEFCDIKSGVGDRFVLAFLLSSR